MIEIREERPPDIAAIREVNAHAFGQNLEGTIVDALRSNGAVLLSLVATLRDRVVGHAAYYPRFGFRPASTYGIVCEWDVPDNVFMVLVTDPEKMRGVSGLAQYRPEFSNVS
jgi:predicted N-acetyltransferase YhbS